MRKYYEAYDDRYRQVHDADLRWASDKPSAIVIETVQKWNIEKDKRILELGCGEGRDAGYLLGCGYDVLATDISTEAIRFCRETNPEHSDAFQTLDFIDGHLEERFDFVYAVAVIHMLVEDAHRDGFYRFIREHLKPNGIALICTMGDGEVERCSNVATAFDLQERTHQESGKTLYIAGTSCRMVNYETFQKEMIRNGLYIEEQGLTSVEPDFPVMMYAVVQPGYEL